MTNDSVPSKAGSSILMIDYFRICFAIFGFRSRISVKGG
jgi:hypothetical protein